MEGNFLNVHMVNIGKYTQANLQNFICLNDLKFENKINIYIYEYYHTFKGSKHDI